MTSTSSSCSAMAASACARPAGLSGGAERVMAGAPGGAAGTGGLVGRWCDPVGTRRRGWWRRYGVPGGRSRDVHPSQGALDGFGPPRVALVTLGLVDGRGPAAVLLPVLAQVLGVLPEADPQAGRVGGPERGRLGDHRADHVDAEGVRLDLHAQVVGGDPA